MDRAGTVGEGEGEEQKLESEFRSYSVLRFFMYDPVNTSHEIFDLAET
jgi:hypothetical protein